MSLTDKRVDYLHLINNMYHLSNFRNTRNMHIRRVKSFKLDYTNFTARKSVPCTWELENETGRTEFGYSRMIRLSRNGEHQKLKRPVLLDCSAVGNQDILSVNIFDLVKTVGSGSGLVEFH